MARKRRTLYTAVIPGVIALNRHEVHGDTVHIFLDTKGQEKPTLVDLADAPSFLRADLRWCCSSNGYAVTPIDRKTCFLHRLILQPPTGVPIDHISGDRLDNRRENLRITTTSANAQNMTVARSQSGIKNVNWSSALSMWTVQICVNQKRMHFGAYPTIEEAAAVAADVRRKYHPCGPENSGRQINSAAPAAPAPSRPAVSAATYAADWGA